MFFDEGVVCERNPLGADLGLSSLQDELTNRLQVGKPEYWGGGGEEETTSTLNTHHGQLKSSENPALTPTPRRVPPSSACPQRSC